MRNKVAIIFVTIVLVLISLYYLSFTVVTKYVESKANKHAVGVVEGMNLNISDIQKKAMADSISKKYLDSLENVVVFPLIKKYTYMNCKERELNLGLDLKGGMNISLEISAEDVVLALSNNRNDSTLVRALRNAKKQAVNQSGRSFISVFADVYKKDNAGSSLASLFVTANNKDKITIKSTDQQVVEYLNSEYDAAIGNAYDVLIKRIDQFGVVQPNIQKDVAIPGVFHIELPGIKDPERVESLLKQAAVLEFWETYNVSEIQQALMSADQIITEQYVRKQKTEQVRKDNLTEPEKQKEEIVVNKDILLDDDIVNDSTEVAEKDVPEVDTVNTNMLFRRLQPIFLQGGDGPVIGAAFNADRESIMKDLNQPQVKHLFPKDIEFAWTFKADKNSGMYQLIALKKAKNGGGVLSGSVVTDATTELGQNSATAGVSMTMNGTGATEWARITKNNINKAIAIVLDGYVYSFPNVNGEITGGRSSITGNFTLAEATDLANVLKSGKMTAPARFLSKEIVGPSLGQKAIDAGLTSFIIAFILILIYMWLYYSKAGLVANVALVSNLFLIFGVLAAMGAVLTLPGIAGIILTLAMSIDANVLIYERVKEEVRAGKNESSSISEGYKRAMPAILDANITTLIVGIILFFYGIGPVKGFATTLIIGILCSLFTAIFVTRLIFDTMLNKNVKITLGNKVTMKLFRNLKIDFIGKRKVAYIISISLIAISLLSLGIRKLNPGIDFAGGRNYVVSLDKIVAPEKVAQELTKSFDGESTIVKVYGAETQLKVSTKYKIDVADSDAEADQKLYEGFKEGGFIGENVTQEEFFDVEKGHCKNSQKVGPSVSKDITSKSIVAVVLSLIFMFIYILIRFRKWQYSLSATLALFHNVLIVMGVFSLCYSFMPFSMEVDLAFIAAILTVIAYSLNDTVVIFDRVREYFRLYPSREVKVNMNASINSTINRTINTSFSTLAVLVAVFIFGGEVIRGFIFAMIVGITVGVFSSVYLTIPFVYDLIKNKMNKIKK